MKLLNKRTYCKLVFLLTYFFIPLLTGQVSQPNFTFNTINNEDGLPNNNINDIVKDKQGFIWMATNDGLCRYESSKRLKIFLGNDPEIPTGLKSSTIRSLFVDSKNNLWIGTAYGGVTRYHQPSETWTTFAHNPKDNSSISNDEIICIQEDKNGRVWIGTEYGLNVFDEKTETFTSFLPNENDTNSLNAKAILSICEDDKGLLWIGTWSGGMYLLIPSENGHIKNSQFRRFSLNDDKHSENVWKIYQDNDRRYWVGTHGGGLFLMDLPEEANNQKGNQNWLPEFYKFGSDKNDKQTLSSNGIQDIYQDEEGDLWIGTIDGLNIITSNFLKSTNLFEDKKMLTNIKFHQFKIDTSNEKMLNNSSVNVIHGGSQGIIWIGTFGGASKYNWHTNQFDIFNFSDHDFQINNLSNFYVDKQGTAWGGNGDKGLFRFDLKKEMFKEIPELNKFKKSLISSVFSSDDIQLFIGTLEGISVLNMKTFDIVDYPFPDWMIKESSEQVIKTLVKDRNGRVWLGTRTGLYTLDIKTQNWAAHKFNANLKNGISDNSITHVIEDSKGTIWIATFNGLSRVVNPQVEADKIEFEVFKYNINNPNASIASNRLLFLKEVNEEILIGTVSGMSGYKLQTGALINYNHLQNKYCIHSIEETKNEKIWMGTTEGIIFFDPVKNTFNKFQKEDGLEDIAFDYGSSGHDSSGNLYFGTTTSITRFNPDNIFRNNEKPPVHITEAKILNLDGGRTINTIFKDELVLNQNDYSLSLSFAGLNYNRSEKNRFAYQLEGFDDKWMHTETNLPIVYTNLDAGTYKFKAKAANNDGVWNEVGKEIKITIKPAFWETWWFIGGNLLLGAFALIAGIKYYNKRVRLRNLELTEFNNSLNKEIEERRRVEVILNQRDQELEDLVHLRTNQLEIEKGKVEALFKRIKVRNEELEKIVANRTKNLIESNNELSRSNKDLEQFAYMASHDLQEPIRLISNFVNLLGKKYKDLLPDNAMKIIELTNSATQRMDSLIRSLLTYSKVGQKGMEFEMTNVKVMLQNKMLDLDQKIEERNVNLRIGEMPNVFCEKNQLGMVFYNLVNNAIKFNNNAIPVVEIKQEKDAPDGVWKFSVKDNGIGIEEKYQKKIFEVFSRLNNKSEFEGTGIGLALCQKIIASHGGEIWIKSEYGFGTTFFITIDKNLKQKVEDTKERLESNDLLKSLYN